MPDVIEVERTIAATPQRLYELVSDLPRMGEWSPENQGGRWLDGASRAAVGARFRGRNRIGWRRWSTTATVTVAAPAEAFAFRVHVGPLAVAEWGFRFRPAEGSGSATVVTQSFEDRRGAVMNALGTLVTNVTDRAGHNRVTMEQTLAGLAATAERD